MSGKIEEDPRFKLIDVWKTKGMGTLKIYNNGSDGSFWINKQLHMHSELGINEDELTVLEDRWRQLPEEISLLSQRFDGVDDGGPMFDHRQDPQEAYIEYSAMNLGKILMKRKESNQTVSEDELLSFFGFFLGLGSLLENTLEFHRSVCLKNLLIVKGQLALINPYVSDNHLKFVLEVELLYQRNSFGRF